MQTISHLQWQRWRCKRLLFPLAQRNVRSGSDCVASGCECECAQLCGRPACSNKTQVNETNYNTDIFIPLRFPFFCRFYSIVIKKRRDKLCIRSYVPPLSSFFECANNLNERSRLGRTCASERVCQCVCARASEKCSESELSSTE